MHSPESPPFVKSGQVRHFAVLHHNRYRVLFFHTCRGRRRREQEVARGPPLLSWLGAFFSHCLSSFSNSTSTHRNAGMQVQVDGVCAPGAPRLSDGAAASFGALVDSGLSAANL